MGSFASQGAVWPYMALSPQNSGQADFSLLVIAVSPSTDLFILEWPHPFYQDVVVAALSSYPAELDLLGLQQGHEAN